MELQDWNHLQGFPRFSKALQGDLAQGGCNNYKGCPLNAVPGGSSFNFDKLEEGALAAITPAWMTTLLKVYRKASVGGLVAWVLAGILIYQKIRRAREGPGTTTTNSLVSTQPPVPAPLPPAPAPLQPPPPSRHVDLLYTATVLS